MAAFCCSGAVGGTTPRPARALFAEVSSAGLAKFTTTPYFPSTHSTQLSLLPSQKSTGGPKTDTATSCGCATLLHRSWLQNAMQNPTSKSGSQTPTCSASAPLLLSVPKLNLLATPADPAQSQQGWGHLRAGSSRRSPAGSQSLHRLRFENNPACPKLCALPRGCSSPHVGCVGSLREAAILSQKRLPHITRQHSETRPRPWDSLGLQVPAGSP